MHATMRRLLCALAFAAFAACVPSAAFAQGVSESVEIKGLVAQPARFTAADLATLATKDVTLKSESGATRTYRGVLLRDLVAACKPVESNRFDLRQSYYVARATDGYLAVFSWAELFNGPVGDEVLVAFAVNGAALDDGEGRIALVSGRDTRSGPRHVRWLSSIDVRRAQP